MRPGLYKLEVFGFGVKSTGVAVISGETLLGGDSGYYFTGSIVELDGRLHGAIRAGRHTSDLRAAFGPLPEVTLELIGDHDGDTVSLRGAARELRAISVAVVLSPIVLDAPQQQMIVGDPSATDRAAQQA